MDEYPDISGIVGELSHHRSGIRGMKERILSDAVMIGEIPSPTFKEENLVRFLRDRFTEEGLDSISTDETGNAVAMLRGTGSGERRILIAAHVDKIWEPGIDHTVTVASDRITGPGIGDNALGVAALTSLPSILSGLGIELESDIVLLGASRSLGRGDLGGLRFFLENTRQKIDAAVCLEGMQLGRLSYSSLGMNRGEIRVHAREEKDWESLSLSGAIPSLNWIIGQILRIGVPEVPKTSIILGSIQAGSTYNTPPLRASLRFEVRSEEPGMVARIRERIEELIQEANAEHKTKAELTILSRRRPGSIGFNHPLVRAARELMTELEIKPKIAPSTSELSALLDKEIPALTLGLTRGENKHDIDETIEIDPMFTGFAHLIGVLRAIDHGVCDE